MKEIHDILSGFRTLKEYTEFMEQLVEKSTSGQEISRGMDQHDKSKQQKQKVVTKEVKKSANGAATETHYDHVDLSPEEPTNDVAPPMPMPQIEPGMQVSYGNKVVDDSQISPRTVEVDISGEKDSLNMKPRVDKNPNNNFK